MQEEGISVIGLGKLGAPLAATIASRGFTVVGLDINEATVRALNNGEAPVFEPELARLITENRERLRATTDYAEAIASSSISFLIVPTPSEPDGGFSTAYVEKAAHAIGSALKDKDSYHVVVLASTVLPGASKKIIDILEAASGKACGTGFGFCYNPQFIALGSVVRNLLYPDMELIGEHTKKDGDMLEAFYRIFCAHEPQIRRIAIINAELAKIAINSFITTKITFANLLMLMCDALPGGNVDEVTAAVGSDSRIGHKYLKGGMGYGGPCFPRDNKAIASLFARYGIDHPLARAVDETNRKLVSVYRRKIETLVPKHARITLLGLSYKPDTDVIDESQGVMLAQELIEEGFDVTVYDPAAMENARKLLPDARFAASLEASLADTDAVCITTPWAAFTGTDVPGKIAVRNHPVPLIDFWRAVKKEDCPIHVRYVSFGTSIE